MLAVGLAEAEARSALGRPRGPRLDRRRQQPDRASTLAGDARALEDDRGPARAGTASSAASWTCKVPYHSHHMDPLRGRSCWPSLAGISPRTPAIPLYSTVTGTRSSTAPSSTPSTGGATSASRSASRAAVAAHDRATATTSSSSSARTRCSARRSASAWRSRASRARSSASLRRQEDEPAAAARALGAPLRRRRRARAGTRCYPTGGRPVRAAGVPLAARAPLGRVRGRRERDRLGEPGPPAAGPAPQRGRPDLGGQLEPPAACRILSRPPRSRARSSSPAPATSRWRSPPPGRCSATARTTSSGSRSSARSSCSGRRRPEGADHRSTSRPARSRSRARRKGGARPAGRRTRRCSCGRARHGRRHVAIGDIWQRCGELLTGPECYQPFERLGFQYGPRFQGIENIWRGADELLGELVGAASRPATSTSCTRPCSTPASSC